MPDIFIIIASVLGWIRHLKDKGNTDCVSDEKVTLQLCQSCVKMLKVKGL